MVGIRQTQDLNSLNSHRLEIAVDPCPKHLVLRARKRRLEHELGRVPPASHMLMHDARIGAELGRNTRDLRATIGVVEEVKPSGHSCWYLYYGANATENITLLRTLAGPVVVA